MKLRVTSNIALNGAYCPQMPGSGLVGQDLIDDGISRKAGSNGPSKPVIAATHAETFGVVRMDRKLWRC